MTQEEKQRVRAIQRYLARGVKHICKDLNRSRNWFYKWKKRYFANPNGHGYKERSRAPKTAPIRLDPMMECLILSSRQKLESERYARIGPQAIDWEIRRLGY